MYDESCTHGSVEGRNREVYLVRQANDQIGIIIVTLGMDCYRAWLSWSEGHVMRYNISIRLPLCFAYTFAHRGTHGQTDVPDIGLRSERGIMVSVINIDLI